MNNKAHQSYFGLVCVINMHTDHSYSS